MVPSSPCIDRYFGNRGSWSLMRLSRQSCFHLMRFVWHLLKLLDVKNQLASNFVTSRPQSLTEISDKFFYSCSKYRMTDYVPCYMKTAPRWDYDLDTITDCRCKPGLIEKVWSESRISCLIKTRECKWNWSGYLSSQVFLSRQRCYALPFVAR